MSEQEREPLRREMLSRREALGPGERLAAARAVAEHLRALPPLGRAKRLFVYLSRGSELDTAPCRALGRELGLELAAPRADPASTSLRFHRLPPQASLEAGPYGILQPSAAEPALEPGEGDIALVPGAAFDRRGNRLGYGQGYYDRWLAGEGTGLLKVGLAYDFQCVERLPSLPHDVPMDCLLSEAGLWECRRD